MNRRRRVLVEARTPVSLAVLGPMIDALAHDMRVDLHAIGGDSPIVQKTIDATYPRARRITPSEARWTRFDLLLNADPWGSVTLRRCRRRINFFHGVAGKYDLDCPSGMPAGFERYFAVAFVNVDRMERYLNAGIVSPRQAVLVGYPKLDALVNGSFDAGAVRRALRLSSGRPTALFAPTWSTASALHLAGEMIIERLLTAGFNVIVKLHDRSLETSERFTGGIDWRARLSRFASNPAFAHAEGHDSSPYLAAADLMVTDHSSVGFEFLALDRPLLVYDAPDLAAAARINPEKIALLRSAAEVVRTPDALVDAARRALQSPGHCSEARRRVADAIFHRPGSATERALQICYKALDLTPAVTASAVAQHPGSSPGRPVTNGAWL